MYDQLRLSDFLTQIEHDPKFRLLRKVAIREGRTGHQGDLRDCLLGAVVDVETTGLDPDGDQIVELAIRRFDFDRDGRVLQIRRGRSWCEDPGYSVDREISRITSLSDADLAGEMFDDLEIIETLNAADIIIAHNAPFDRKFVERRFPGARGRPWACTLREVDWCGHGFEGRQLGWLLAQTGWFHDAHRALNDVDAVMQLLQVELYAGQSTLAELLRRASQESWLVRAMDAPYEKRRILKARGYSWDSNRRVWWREVYDDEIRAEERWLFEKIYASGAYPRSANPVLERITWRERHA